MQQKYRLFDITADKNNPHPSTIKKLAAGRQMENMNSAFEKFYVYRALLQSAVGIN